MILDWTMAMVQKMAMVLPTLLHMLILGTHPRERKCELAQDLHQVLTEPIRWQTKAKLSQQTWLT